MRYLILITTVAIGVLSGTDAAAQNAGREQLRFTQMDRNGDGRITRAEWRGTARSFDVHDWNRDGVLSGDELRQGARRQPRARSDADFNSADSEYAFDDWTMRGFESLDHNRDNRVTADEWHFDREGFQRADHNRDGVISRAEFLNESPIDDERDDRFQFLDANRDGRVSRGEWRGTAERFAALDNDRNGYLTRNEMYGTEPPPDLFASVDTNHDGVVQRSEWHWSGSSFDNRDANRDGRLTRAEFAGSDAPSTRSEAYRAGYERGRVEGRQAGAEDGARKTWDLEGQRELEQADSGYYPNLGARAEYQAGYREGFRRAYREGFGR
jgi:Ca2+-binding EF-hand superfamily protein